MSAFNEESLTISLFEAIMILHKTHIPPPPAEYDLDKLDQIDHLLELGYIYFAIDNSLDYDEPREIEL